jgi:hypothetical protein
LAIRALDRRWTALATSSLESFSLELSEEAGAWWESTRKIKRELIMIESQYKLRNEPAAVMEHAFLPVIRIDPRYFFELCHRSCFSLSAATDADASVCPKRFVRPHPHSVHWFDYNPATWAKKYFSFGCSVVTGYGGGTGRVG